MSLPDLLLGVEVLVLLAVLVALWRQYRVTR